MQSGILWIMANWYCISCFISRTLIRGKIRASNRISGSGCGGEYFSYQTLVDVNTSMKIILDCCTVFWCTPCTVCQESAQVGSMDDVCYPLVPQVNQIQPQMVTVQPVVVNQPVTSQPTTVPSYLQLDEVQGSEIA